eukprot:1046047-Pleurochrysis_carterae.AAC.1
MQTCRGIHTCQLFGVHVPGLRLRSTYPACVSARCRTTLGSTRPAASSARTPSGTRYRPMTRTRCNGAKSSGGGGCAVGSGSTENVAPCRAVSMLVK